MKFSALAIAIATIVATANAAPNTITTPEHTNRELPQGMYCEQISPDYCGLYSNYCRVAQGIH